MKSLHRRPETVDEFLRPPERPRVIAHRGFSGAAPENTLAAFEKALALDVDMIELDVLLSADEHLVVVHDDDLGRTTNGEGPVHTRTLAELKTLDAGTWFSEAFAGERIPTLHEVFELVGDRVLINVEIKDEAVTDRVRGGITDHVIDTVKEHGLASKVIFSSFEPRALVHAREIDPQIRRASLFNEDLHGDRTPLEVMDEVGSVSFNLGREQVTAETVKACHAHGRRVLVYTVNEVADMEHAISLGVDGLFTDRPDRLLGLLDS
ncbi:MAG: glycerophosphodiester phosphodiesterase [Planctomycetota bacterium]|jgi:glycerophosphoryl diester phosphodiesterase